MSINHAYDVWLDQVEVQLPNSRSLFQISDWKIAHGSHVLVQGPSGSGKTTLLHLIAGLFRPQLGNVHIGSINLASLSEGARCDLRRESIGVVFQKLNLLSQLTVSENIQLVLKPEENAKSKTTDERLRSSLKRVRMLEKIADRCSHLSLGEQQRVAVARVLAQAPQIILADEPTSSLDAPNACFVIEALKEAAIGRTLIVVSHDERIASHFNQVRSFLEIIR